MFLILTSCWNILLNMLSILVKKWAKPELFGSGSLKKFILDRSKVVHEMYRPPLLCLNPGVQFFVRTKYEKKPPVKIYKSTLTLPDNGVIAFDRIASPKEAKGGPAKSEYVVLIAPGVRETTHSTKILTMAHDLIKVGYDTVHVMNYRGSCSIPLMTRQFSHSCEGYNDMAAAVDELLKMYPDKKVLLVGACVGAQCVTDYLASHHAAQTPAVVGAVIHSSLWELKKETLNISSGINYHLFNKVFVEDVVSRNFKYSNETERKLKEDWFKEVGVVQEEAKKCKTIWEFEEYVFSRIYSWSGADEYYRRTSTASKIHNICKPIVWINSRDDFMAPFSDFDLEALLSNPRVVLWSTAAGGHVSFVDGLFPVTSYLSKVVPECAQLVCQFTTREGEVFNE